MTLATGSRLGPYEILAPIGAGGMGEVYRARDTRLGREVALKVLPEALASDLGRLSRFEQEARAASALNHPNIVTIHDIGREGDTEFIAMEFVDGKTLRELAVAGPMPVRRILGVAAQVAEGLAKAHAAGIVHRDVKPENVMVSKDGFVKILDFGLAKLVEPESGEASAMPTQAHPETHPGTVMGTVGYMSPEQASGEPLDFRSDQFSLGSVLYEMATGQKAFQRKTVAETMSAIIREEPEPASKLRPDLPLPVRWILERCLAKDPEERYASTRDLARDLAGLRDHISEASSGSEALLVAPGKSRRRALSTAAWLALLVAGIAATWAMTRGMSTRAPSAPSFRRLTFRRGQLGNARFAPDGHTVVYGAIWEGEPYRMQLYLTHPESPESQPFNFSGDILSISGSGELAILLNDGGSIGTLARVPMAGGVPREVLETVTYAGADFAPDGKDLAVAHLVDGKARLEFPVGKTLVPQGVDAPRLSPGGDAIAFLENGDGPSIAWIDREGKSKKTLSSGWDQIHGAPCWRPDGKEIWFTAAQRGESAGLWAVNLSGKRRLIMRAPGDLELDDVSRDGRALLAHHTTLNLLRGLRVGELKERELSWLDSSRPADLSSDGKTLLLEEQGEGAGTHPVIYLRGTDGSPAVRLGEGFGIALSPDGKWVLASTLPVRGGTPSLVLLPTGAGQTKTLEHGFSDVRGGAWFPDGRSILFTASTANEASRIYELSLPDGKPRAIGAKGVALPVLSNPISPDGKFVVGMRSGHAVVCPVDGGEPRAVPGLTQGDHPIQWASDGRSLYVYRRELPVRVFLVDVTTGEKRLWREIQAEGIGGFVRVRITPDGKSYVYSGNRVLSELYLVDGLR